MASLYDVLGVSRTAKTSEVRLLRWRARAARQRLARGPSPARRAGQPVLSRPPLHGLARAAPLGAAPAELQSRVAAAAALPRRPWHPPVGVAS
jgi:hypothetical protein